MSWDLYIELKKKARRSSRCAWKAFSLWHTVYGFPLSKHEINRDQIVLYIPSPSPTRGFVDRTSVRNIFASNLGVTFHPICTNSAFKQVSPNQLDRPEAKGIHPESRDYYQTDARLSMDRCTVHKLDRTLRRSRSLEKILVIDSLGNQPNGKRHDWFSRSPPFGPPTKGLWDYI